MLYEIRDGKIQTNAVEYSVTYHCNLKCSGCSHMSPFIAKKFPPLESFTRDVNALSEVLHARDIRMVGGEPLANPEIVDFLKAAKQSGIADQVMLTTNGLLLHSMPDEFWDYVDFIWVSLYPGASPPQKVIDQFRAKAEETGTRMDLDYTSHFRTTVTTEAHTAGYVTDMIFRTCQSAHLFHCHMIYEGWIFKCACPPFMPEYLGRFGITYSADNDGFDIHNAGNLAEDLRDFLFTPKTLEACRYCLGYVGKWQEHHQLTKEQIASPNGLKVSRKTDMSKRKFLQETAKYYGRRVTEKLAGGRRW